MSALVVHVGLVGLALLDVALVLAALTVLVVLAAFADLPLWLCRSGCAVVLVALVALAVVALAASGALFVSVLVALVLWGFLLFRIALDGQAD